MDFKAREKVAGFLLHTAKIQEEAPRTRMRELAPEEEIGGDIEVIGEREILIHRFDAEILSVAWAAETHGMALEHDLALIRSDRTGQHFDQRRFARGVVAAERVDLAGEDPEVDPVERRHAAVALRDGAHLR